MLTTHEKLELIREIAKKHEISSYEIGENTEISNKTAYNILNDDKIKPRNKTLNIILEYLETEIVGKEDSLTLRPKTNEKPILKIVAESSQCYQTQFNKLKIDDKLNLIYKELLTIKKTLQEN